MKKLLLLIGFGFTIACHAIAQNYHAVQGSSYAGSLGVLNNPASIVNTPYKWDITVFGVQAQTSTNAITIYDYSYLSSPANSLYYFKGGNYARYAKANVNLNLFNTRIALGRKQSIAFGANLESYTNIKTSSYNFIDTLGNSGQFFAMNQPGANYTMDVVSSSWIELYGTYSRTVVDDERSRLNVGATIKLSRGISGAYARLDNGRFTSTVQGNQTSYLVTGASLVYGYSSNFDRWQTANSSGQNLNNFLAYTEGGASFDLGLEYLVKPQGTTSFEENDDDNYYDYDWKLGVALLGVGGNQYKYGAQSRVVSGVKANITSVAIDNKFSGVGSVQEFNDSLATLVNQSAGISGKFNVINPMRLVLNADRYLGDAFFVNAELSLNMPSSFMKNYLQVKELNFITVTPRWETKKLGFYLPIQFNNQNQFWIGGAVKAGPLLMGIHNLANLFSKTSTQNGGGYIALVFRAPHNSEKKSDKKLDCPRSK